MSNTLDAITELEQNLNSLLSNYEFLKEENKILLKNSTKLQQEVLEKEQLLKQQEQEFQLLKIAKTIEGSSENSRDAKLKINALIREIDKCISHLQE